MDVSVRAIILAAGSGTRIGLPKLYLKIGERYFLDKICENLFDAGINNVSAVIADEYENTVFKNRLKISWIINPNPKLGMISSVYHGINSGESADGYLIIPVDHPKIQSETFYGLVTSFSRNKNSVIVATYKGVSGHPLVIPKSLALQIENKDYSEGLRGIIRSSGMKIIVQETNDAGVLKNINTKNDLIGL